MVKGAVQKKVGKHMTRLEVALTAESGVDGAEPVEMAALVVA